MCPFLFCIVSLIRNSIVLSHRFAAHATSRSLLRLALRMNCISDSRNRCSASAFVIPAFSSFIHGICQRGLDIACPSRQMVLKTYSQDTSIPEDKIRAFFFPAREGFLSRTHRESFPTIHRPPEQWQGDTCNWVHAQRLKVFDLVDFLF